MSKAQGKPNSNSREATPIKAKKPGAPKQAKNPEKPIPEEEEEPDTQKTNMDTHGQNDGDQELPPAITRAIEKVMRQFLEQMNQGQDFQEPPAVKEDKQEGKTKPILSFNPGTTTDVNEWLDEYEQMVGGVDDEERIALLEYHLLGGALEWYRDTIDPIADQITWKGVRKLMANKFSKQRDQKRYAMLQGFNEISL